LSTVGACALFLCGGSLIQKLVRCLILFAARMVFCYFITPWSHPRSCLNPWVRSHVSIDCLLRAVFCLALSLNAPTIFFCSVISATTDFLLSCDSGSCMKKPVSFLSYRIKGSSFSGSHCTFVLVFQTHP
jgi:hypothetical protein